MSGRLAFIIEQHPWCWTRTMKTLVPAANIPADPQWDTAFNLPADLVHLIYARIENRPCIYQVMKGPDGSPSQLCTNAQGGPPAPIPPQVPAPVTIAYISSDTSDLQISHADASPSPSSNTSSPASIAVCMRTRRWRCSSLKFAEPHAGAGADAGTISRCPKRALYNSRMLAARRLRRPAWPPVPGGWYGSGTPG